MLSVIAISTTLFLIAMLFGSMTFFAAIVTPAAFKSLDKEHTGRYLQTLFPRYYSWGLIIAITAALSAKLIAWSITLLMAVIAVGFLSGRRWLLPRIEQCRQAAQAGDQVAQHRFRRLHAISVAIHMAQTILLIVAFVLTWRVL